MRIFERLRAAVSAVRHRATSAPAAPEPTGLTGAKPTLPWVAIPPSADERFARCVEIVLKHEAGFVDHPSDPGGATNHGISLRYARSKGSMWDLDGDGDVDKQDILLVTPEKAAIAYRSWFWADVRGDDLPAGLDLVTFDFAVNSGPGRATKALQAALGVQPDGVIGPATMRAVREGGERVPFLITAVTNERLNFLRTLKTWPTFGRGWTRRVFDVQERAASMVRPR